jgi:hypothetical protein
MKFIKLAAISVVVFSLLLFFMSLLFPSQVRVSRAININASKKKIQERIKDLSTWPEWNQLYNDNVNITIVSADSQYINTRWQYKQNVLYSSFMTEESAHITVLQWYFDFRVKWYPWQKIGSIMFDKQFGPPMESSLNNLKKLVEKSP